MQAVTLGLTNKISLDAIAAFFIRHTYFENNLALTSNHALTHSNVFLGNKPVGISIQENLTSVSPYTNC
jgi:hypothetical protein